MKTKTLTHLAMLTAIMLVLGLMERQFVLVPGVEALFCAIDGTVTMTEGMESVARSGGASSGK